MENKQQEPSVINARIHETMRKLKNINLVVILMDKTNCAQTIYLKEYKHQMNFHLLASATEKNCNKLLDLHKRAKTLAKNFKQFLSKNKSAFLIEGIETKAILTLMPVIKDHKKKMKGRFSM